MRAVMVSDVHATGLGDPSQDSFVRWLDELQADRLYLLGDIFHHWWGYPDVVWAPYVPLCEALRRVSARGVDLVFVPGNHDFAVGAWLEEVVGLRVRGVHVELLDGVRYLLAHGDEADSSSGYRLTRAVLRGAGFATLMRALGPANGHALIRKLAGASRAHGGDAEPLVRAQQVWAAERLGRQADLVVMGHIHVPRMVPTADGTIVHLGDWVEHRTWLEVVDGQPRLLHGLDGQPWSG